MAPVDFTKKCGISDFNRWRKIWNPIKVVNPHNPDPAENPEITNVPFYSFNIILSSTNARYIKVHAESVLEMPSWHINAGKPAFIYIDEIVVK